MGDKRIMTSSYSVGSPADCGEFVRSHQITPDRVVKHMIGGGGGGGGVFAGAICFNIRTTSYMFYYYRTPTTHTFLLLVA